MKVLNKLNTYSFLNLTIYTSDKNFVKKNKIFKNKKQFISELLKNKQKYDFLISVYFPWLIPKKLFNRFENSINFHPSFLPIARGWYPHVHSNNKKTEMGCYPS